MSSGRLSTVAVLHGAGSATPFEVAVAGQGICTIVFLIDHADPFPGVDPRGLGRVVDLTDLPFKQRVRELAALDVAGVTTFSEYRLAQAARLAGALGLPGHSAATIEALTDKLRQREALAAAGVQGTASVAVTAASAAAEVASTVGLPCVVKPRSGAGSRHTTLEHTVADLEQRLASLPPDEEYVAEEYLDSAEVNLAEGWGDYVSVESVSSAGRSYQVCLTGKFAMASGFRERGMILPCPVEEDLGRAVLGLEAQALRALDVRHGVTHTEIKLTAKGPRIIEVNGRVGGYVPEILHRAGGPNLVECALRSALGEHVAPEPTRPGSVTFQRFITAPEQVGSLASIEGIDRVERLPGVLKVVVSTAAGDHVDWHFGTESRVGLVLAEAPTLAAAAKLSNEIDAALEVILA